MFYSRESDWGYSPFITMKELLNPETGYYNALNDSITLEVWLKADEPHCESFVSETASKRKERNETNHYIDLNIITEEEFYKNLDHTDLYDHTKIEATNKHLRVKKHSTIIELMRLISDDMKVASIRCIRIWSVVIRANLAIRPENVVDLREQGHKTVQEVSKQDSKWTIFVEKSNDLSFSLTFDYMSLLSEHPAPLCLDAPASNLTLPNFNSKEEVMIFFKFYEPKTSTLRYVFRMHLSISVNLTKIQEKINKKMKFSSDTQLLFFEEENASQITPLTDRVSNLWDLKQARLFDGDIYLFQIDEKEKLTAYKLPLVGDYFNFLNPQVEISFYDKTTPNMKMFELTLSHKMKYDELAKYVSHHLKCDPQKLKLFRASSSDLKRAVFYELKSSSEFQLKDTLNMINKRSGHKLYFQKLN